MSRVMTFNTATVVIPIDMIVSAVNFTYSTTATVGNRRVFIQWTNAAGDLKGNALASANQAAASGAVYSFFDGINSASVADVAYSDALPSKWFVNRDDVLTISDINGVDVADVVDAVSLTFELLGWP